MDLKFAFSFKTKPYDSFRCKALYGQYDLENKEHVQSFVGDHKLPEKWNIGLIVGNSGTGKTSIAKQCFGEFTKNVWDDKPIIDNFNSALSLDQITFCLGSVGFNSVPYWLKPYSVLSNGEKQRVDIARMLAEHEFSIFDEFSSLVDRDVAKSMAHSVQKAVKKLDKKMVLISCHKDIKEWLQPDWVYDTDEKCFFLPQNIREKNSNLKLEESQTNDGIFIKSIII